MAEMKHTVSIIGGGPSGLAAARKLKERDIDFTLLTDRLGGRMYHSEDCRRNLGATYLNEDYKNILKYARRGRRLKLREVWSSDGKRLIPFFSPLNLKHLPSLIRTIAVLRKLRRELNSFRVECETVPQHECLESYPLIKKLASTTVREFVDEIGVQYLHNKFFRYVFLATCFAEPDDSNALFYLGTLFPLIIPTYMVDYTGTLEAMTRGIEDSIKIDLAVEIKREESGFIVNTQDGDTYYSEYVILASPYHNASKLWKVPRPKKTTDATVLYVKGKRTKSFRGKKFVMLNPEDDNIGLVWTQDTGEDLIFSLTEEPDLSKIYTTYELKEKANWKTAVVLSEREWSPMVLESNLYLVGDYNVCGLEDSFITGICAGNLISREVRND